MRVVARPTWEELEWATALARAHVRCTLPPELAPLHLEARAEIPAPDSELVAALRQEPGCGAQSAWEALATPGAAAVVTGQQPGCLGGPLLVLYKAATAVALARRASRARGAAVVPVFWNAADDDDFAEVARVGWLQPDARLDFVELPRRGHSGWVGDLAAALDTDAAAAVLRGDRATTALLPRAAPDHGVWVAQLLARLFPDLAIVDGRSAALRRAAAPLFARYLDAAPDLAAAIAAQSQRMTAHGFVPVLSAASVRLGLHLTPQRRRAKLGDDWQPLRDALAAAPETVSPNVVLRALVQDALLPTLAHVVGPSELAYLIELRPARAALAVREPALVPRFGATCIDAAAWDALAGIEPRRWLHDPGAAWDGIAGAGAADGHLDSAFVALGERLAAAPLAAATRDRATRKLQALREEIDVARRDAARDAWLERNPALRGLEAWVRPRGKPQERVLALLWLVARCGGDVAEVVALADAHLDDVAAGRAAHPIVALEAST